MAQSGHCQSKMDKLHLNLFFGQGNKLFGENSGDCHNQTKLHYENKLTKNIRPTDILQIYTSI